MLMREQLRHCIDIWEAIAVASQEGVELMKSVDGRYNLEKVARLETKAEIYRKCADLLVEVIRDDFAIRVCSSSLDPEEVPCHTCPDCGVTFTTSPALPEGYCPICRSMMTSELQGP